MNASYLLTFDNQILNEFEEESKALYHIAILERIEGKIEVNRIALSYRGKDVDPTYGPSYSLKEAICDWVKNYKHKYSKLNKYKIYKVVK